LRWLYAINTLIKNNLTFNCEEVRMFLFKCVVCVKKKWVRTRRVSIVVTAVIWAVIALIMYAPLDLIASGVSIVGIIPQII